MAEHSTAGAPALSTNIESGKFDEKEAHRVPAAKQPVEEEEEDEDIDALIDDLESNDGHGDVSSPLSPHPAISPLLLQCAMHCGAQSSAAVMQRAISRFSPSPPPMRHRPESAPTASPQLATGVHQRHMNQ